MKAKKDCKPSWNKYSKLLLKFLGRPSRWSGKVELGSDPSIRGAKPFRCDIIINVNLAKQNVRWRTLIHEMLHTFSEGYQPLDYVSDRGWEEGTVEQLQRLLRPGVLATLGVSLEEDIFASVEQDHDYTKYIEALEEMRGMLEIEPPIFYLNLLTLPIRDRRRSVFDLGMALPLDKRFRFLIAYSAGNAVLRTGVKQ